MKQTLIIVLLLLLLCGVLFVFIHLLLSPAPGSNPAMPAQNLGTSSTTQSASTTVVSNVDPSQSASSSTNLESNPSDGPFAVFDSQGNDTGATLNISRSPEEVLIQFEDFSKSYPDGSRLYLAKDLSASQFVDLGPARLNYGVYLYDIPMDANTVSYPYIGIFSTSSNTFSYYVRIP